MVRLTVTGKVLYPQVFESPTLRRQLTLVPDGKVSLLERPWSRPTVSIAPIVRTDESAYDVIFRNWHGASLEQSDKL